MTTGHTPCEWLEKAHLNQANNELLQICRLYVEAFNRLPWPSPVLSPAWETIYTLARSAILQTASPPTPGTALPICAPHECDDADCPGNRNRLKLEAFEEMKAITRALLESAVEQWLTEEELRGRTRIEIERAGTVPEQIVRARAALAKSEKLG